MLFYIYMRQLILFSCGIGPQLLRHRDCFASNQLIASFLWSPLSPKFLNLFSSAKFNTSYLSQSSFQLSVWLPLRAFYWPSNNPTFWFMAILHLIFRWNFYCSCNKFESFCSSRHKALVSKLLSFGVYLSHFNFSSNNYIRYCWTRVLFFFLNAFNSDFPQGSFSSHLYFINDIICTSSIFHYLPVIILSTTPKDLINIVASCEDAVASLTSEPSLIFDWSKEYFLILPRYSLFCQLALIFQKKVHSHSTCNLILSLISLFFAFL